MAPPLTFSERIRRRLTLWWGQPPLRGEWLTRRYAWHALRERYTLRRRDEPERSWRCCAFWQRTLLNKWNAREFALRHGCAVPALYWCARLPSAARLRALPSRFVLRPVWGTARQGVYVVAEGHDLLRGIPFSAAELRRSIRRSGRLAWTLPLLAEECLCPGGPPRLPMEYKCHTFGDRVAAVEAIERTGVSTARQRYYTADWRPFADPMSTALPQAQPSDPPCGLKEMIESAVRLGSAVGTYLRVDFLATERGCVFNEFSSTPDAGAGFTAYCDELFGALWQEKLPLAT